MGFIKYIIIFVVVIALPVAAGKIHAHKREKIGEDPTVTPHNFVISQMNSLYLTIFIVALALFITIGAGMLINEGFSTWLLIPIAFILLTLYGLLDMLVWKVEVTDNEITYRNKWGQVQHFTISDITDVTYKVMPSGMFERKLTFYSNGRKLFTIDENTDDVYLMQRIEENGVQVREV